MDIKLLIVDLILTLLIGIHEKKFKDYLIPNIELKNLLISLQTLLYYIENKNDLDVFLDEEEEEKQEFINKYYVKRKNKAKKIMSKLFKAALKDDKNVDIMDEYEFLNTF